MNAQENAPVRCEHTLPPIYDENSKVLILGSFPSPRSRKEGMYYAHPQNRFWKALAAALGEKEPGSAQQRREFALKKGIALYDVAESCDIKGAADSTLKNVRPADLSVFKECKIRKVFVTGKTAAKLYKKFFGEGAVTLPSPSPANCAVPLQKLVESYREIAEYLDV